MRLLIIDPAAPKVAANYHLQGSWPATINFGWCWLEPPSLVDALMRWNRGVLTICCADGEADYQVEPYDVIEDAFPAHLLAVRFPDDPPKRGSASAPTNRGNG